MTESFAGQVILITGAASGIGKATAIKLAKLGASLALTDINEIDYEIQAPENTGTEDPTHIITAELDVSDASQCSVVVSEVAGYFGRLDHIFNCAGINPTAYPLLDMPDGYFDKLISVNLKGVYNMTKAAIPHLKEHSGCSFVNVSSVLGQRPAKEMAAYCATKYAVIGFSKSMALELGPKGIRVNIICPGNTDTPTNISILAGPDAVKVVAAQVSLGRLGSPEEIADCVAFLMSDAASYMNGSILEVNGGVGL
jgi:NAD(P)-dependent dehydrogenase (short-subunit alcohol dehydrogenase family)